MLTPIEHTNRAEGFFHLAQVLLAVFRWLVGVDQQPLGPLNSSLPCFLVRGLAVKPTDINLDPLGCPASALRNSFSEGLVNRKPDVKKRSGSICRVSAVDLIKALVRSAVQCRDFAQRVGTFPFDV